MAQSTVELMKLLGELTGWGDQDLGVRIGYKRARNVFGEDSLLDAFDWGFTAAVEICGINKVVSAQGKTLEQALYNLAHEILNSLISTQRWYTEKVAAVKCVLERADQGG